MNIQKKIKEAMKRRHQNEAGFTLIELLVVILIIAILAAVAIAAFLSSLDSAKKSNATQLVRTTQSEVVSIQAGKGSSDYADISIGANGTLPEAEKDITFVALGAAVTPNKNVVGVAATATTVTIQAADSKGCYQAVMTVGQATSYSRTKSTSATPCTAAFVQAGNDRQAAWK